jgi:hypothetical protein
VAVGVTVALYAVPGGDLLGRPLVWVSTLAHELGHGAVTALVGGDVVAIRIAADGSGVAEARRPAGRLRSAAVAAGGLIGPAAAAALLFAVGRRRRLVRPAAVAVGLVLLATVLVAVRGVLGVVLTLLLSVGAVALGLRAPPAWTQVVVLFIAVQLSLSVFSRGDYLFTPVAQTAIGPVPSDSAQIAMALAGPYWLWGALCGLLSVAILVLGLAATLRSRDA